MWWICIAQHCCLLALDPFKLTSFKSSLIWEMSVLTFQVQLWCQVLNMLDFRSEGCVIESRPRRLHFYGSKILEASVLRLRCMKIPGGWNFQSPPPPDNGVSYNHIVLGRQTPTIISFSSAQFTLYFWKAFVATRQFMHNMQFYKGWKNPSHCLLLASAIENLCITN